MVDPDTQYSGLRPKESRRDDGDAVLATIRLRSGVNNDRIDQVIPDLVSKPEEMLDVILFHRTAELDFDAQDALVSPLHDQVHFMSPSV
jgi:hypothetical protein